VRRLVVAAATATFVAVLTGCGSANDGTPAATTSSESSMPPSATPSASSSPSSNVVAVDVTISGGQIEPPPARIDVPVGRTVRMTVTSDEHDELHVHGYDLEAELTPGEPGTIEFVADQTGLFEVEGHHSGLQLFQLAVQ
jgi:plastocyanin